MGLMNKSELKEIIRTELSTLLSENTNTLEDLYNAYGGEIAYIMVCSFNMKDKKLDSLSNMFYKLWGDKLQKHVFTNYDIRPVSQGGVIWKAPNKPSPERLTPSSLPKALNASMESAEDALTQFYKNTRNDKNILKYLKAHQKLMKLVEKHLHNEYPDWEKRIDEAIRNPKKWKANLEKALKKYKKGASVHYFPLSGGNYVMVGPKGVQTKDKEAVDVKIRDVGTYDADNSQQVSVGIELNNGHEATWNGTEFEIDDLGCPLLLGKG